MKTTETSKVVDRLAGQGHLVGDEWRPSDAAGSYVHKYAATGKPQAEVGLAGASDVDAAVAAARAAQPEWAAKPPVERAAVLYKLADLLEQHGAEAAELAALDNGTPVSVMNPGFYTAAYVRYYAGWCDKLDGELMSAEQGLSYVRLEPYGVIAAIPPWNGSMMGMGQKCSPALAAGNTVVAKPPELAPFGMLRFAELCLEAGMPPGVLNIVVGGAEAGEALVGHPDVDKISFTGGGVAARKMMVKAADNLTPLALELGGKSANIVFPDADLDTAAGMCAVFGTALLAGQGCALPTRTYVHEDVYDEMVERVLGTLGAFAVGDPLEEASFIGPVVSEPAMERILGVVERAKGDGAKVLTGGERLGGELADGWFIAPTVFGDVDHDSDLARNEVFGPVQAILRFKDEDEVLRLANDSVFGLGAYVHTRDSSRLQRMVNGLQAGTVVANGMGGISPATPFGGYKQSGFGREGGRAGIEEFVQRKTVFIAP
jgi:aldehyde dehydrogenase (NAD+)